MSRRRGGPPRPAPARARLPRTSSSPASVALAQLDPDGSTLPGGDRVVPPEPSVLRVSRYGDEDRLAVGGDLDAADAAHVEAILARLAALADGDETTPGVTPAHGTDAHLVVLVIAETLRGEPGLPLYVGRASRLATPAQWLALLVRDRTCSAPGCSRGPRWCEAHHWQAWEAAHGPTDLETLALLEATLRTG